MFINREKYLSHIKDEEQILNMRKVMDKIEIAILITNNNQVNWSTLYLPDINFFSQFIIKPSPYLKFLYLSIFPSLKNSYALLIF